MSDDSKSHFSFERGGVRVSITGDWAFVQRMYREILRDVDAARPGETSPAEALDHVHDHVVWIIRCSEMIRRIYMADASDFSSSPLRRALDPTALGTLYIDRDAFEGLLPDIADREETLWAKLTDAGRRQMRGEEA